MPESRRVGGACYVPGVVSTDQTRRDGAGRGDEETKAAIIEKHLIEGRVVPEKLREAEALGERMTPEELDVELSTWPVMINPKPQGAEEVAPRAVVWLYDSIRTILADKKLTGELRQTVERLARRARRKRRVVDVEMHLLGDDDRNVLVNRNRAEFFRLAAQIFPKRFGVMREEIAYAWKRLIETMGDQAFTATGGRLRSWNHLVNRPFVALDYAARFGPGTLFEMTPDEIARKQAVSNERARKAERCAQLLREAIENGASRLGRDTWIRDRILAAARSWHGSIPDRDGREWDVVLVFDENGVTEPIAAPIYRPEYMTRELALANYVSYMSHQETAAAERGAASVPTLPAGRARNHLHEAKKSPIKVWRRQMKALVLWQVGGHSTRKLALRLGVTGATVTRDVNEAAARLDLTLRAPDRGGRPQKTAR